MSYIVAFIAHKVKERRKNVQLPESESRTMPSANPIDANIIILAGGISSRMKQEASVASRIDPALVRDARDKSKAMIGVGRDRRPFLDYLLANVENAGYRNVVIVVGEHDDSIRRHYEHGIGAGLFRSLVLSYVAQPIPAGKEKPPGTAHALMIALEAMETWRGRKFTVCNSDNLYSVGALRMLMDDRHDNAMIDYDRSALRFDHERITQFAVIKKGIDGYVEDIIEKPSDDEISRAADSSGRIGVSMNLFRFSYDRISPFLEMVPQHPHRQEKELPVAVGIMIDRHPKSLFAIPLSEHVLDLTMQADLPVVVEYLRGERRNKFNG